MRGHRTIRNSVAAGLPAADKLSGRYIDGRVERWAYAKPTVERRMREITYRGEWLDSDEWIAPYNQRSIRSTVRSTSPLPTPKSARTMPERHHAAVRRTGATVETTGREIEANGTRLYVEESGAGDAIVLVHGFSLDTRMWDDQWEPLSSRYRVVRYDLRGFGRSALPTDQHYRHADDLRALTDALGIEPAHIVGLSLGGGVTLDFAVAHPDAVRSIVTVDAIMPGFDPADLGASISKVWRAARSEPLQTVKELWLEQPLFSGAMSDPAVAARVRAMVDDILATAGWDATRARGSTRRLPAAWPRSAFRPWPSSVRVT